MLEAYVKIAIVDDQKECREQIRRYLDDSQIELVVDEYDSGEELLKKQNSDYNIVFLDIVMGGINGVEIASKIKSRKSNTIIFFITSHTSYISDAMKNKPFQYLTKPLSKEYFLVEFYRAIEECKKMSKTLQYQWDGRLKNIFINDIVYIESGQRKLVIYDCDGNELLASGKIEYEEEKLLAFDFARTHKSYLVNMKYVDYIDKNTLHIKNGGTVPISKKYSAALTKAHRSFISGISI